MRKLFLSVLVFFILIGLDQAQTTELAYQDKLADNSMPASGTYVTAEPVAAQSTVFTYQGKLSDGGNPANGSYDLRFMLFDTATVGTGTQQGTTQTLTNVTVTGGIFTVQLDFGVCASCFNGAARFLEIAVKPTSGGTFTTLSPRQPITSTPYALKLPAFTVNGPYNDFGGTNYTATNTFSGDGAGLSTTPDPALTNGNGKFNSFYGAGAGKANTTGLANAFFGFQAGSSNTNADANAFFGHRAGQSNTTGFFNAFFGSAAGYSNTIGRDNAFFGNLAGQSNTTGIENAFFGSTAGYSNTIGTGNVFFGSAAGYSNTIGRDNAFFGTRAGFINATGNGNTFIGDSTNFNSADSTLDNNTLLGFRSRVTSWVSNGTAIGALAQVTQSNSLILGSINGVNGATADTNVGVGTTTPAAKLHVSGTGGVRLRVDSDSNGGLALTLNNQPGWSVATVTGGQFQIFNDAIGQNAVWIDPATNNLGLGTPTPNDKLDVNGIIRVSTVGTSGILNLCRNASNQISNCSSSLRYKRNIASLHLGLSLINQLRPVKFDWKKGDEHDLGLIAEEVAKIEPLLVTHNDTGEIEGVKYDRIAVVLINAIKEQQRQIEEHHRQIEEHQRRDQEQQRQIEALKKIVCKLSPSEQVCKTSENREQ